MKYKTCLALLVLLTACNGNNGVHPTTKSLVEGVYASGFVVAQNEYQVFAQVDGYLATKIVQDGDLVKKGDPLFIIESDQQSARFRIARENYELVLRNNQNDSPVLQELKAVIASARTKMKFDSVNYVRFSNLWNQKATTKVEFDRYKVQYENSSNELILQSSRLQKTRDQLNVELQNARNQLQIASDESGRYTVRSEVDGKVFQTLKDQGELIRRSEVVAVIGNDTEFYIQLSVDELDIQRVKKDQDVWVRIDAYPDKVFHATVDKVYPMVNQQQQSLRVDAKLRETLPGAFSGLALEANIIIRQKEKALVIPKTALLAGDSVMIKTEDGDRKIKIVKGIETLDEVEVTQGLDSLSTLILAKS